MFEDVKVKNPIRSLKADNKLYYWPKGWFLEFVNPPYTLDF